MEVNPLAGLHPEHSDLPILATKIGMPLRRTDSADRGECDSACRAGKAIEGDEDFDNHQDSRIDMATNRELFAPG